MSKPTKPRPRQLSRAEMKAYEARRAAEVSRSSSYDDVIERQSRVVTPGRRFHPLSRDKEAAIIRADLRRLVIIVVVLIAVLLVLTLFLR